MAKAASTRIVPTQAGSLLTSTLCRNGCGRAAEPVSGWDGRSREMSSLSRAPWGKLVEVFQPVVPPWGISFSPGVLTVAVPGCVTHSVWLSREHHTSHSHQTRRTWAWHRPTDTRNPCSAVAMKLSQLLCRFYHTEAMGIEVQCARMHEEMTRCLALWNKANSETQGSCSRQIQQRCILFKVNSET